MSEHTNLSTLLREHVERTEPPFLLQPEPVLERGRRRLRRRRLSVAAVAVVVGAAVAAPAVVSRGDGSGAVIDPATAYALAHYDAQQMPATLRAAAGDALQQSGADLGSGTFDALDGRGTSLPARYWDKASSMSVTYGGATDDRFTLLLMHARSEAEGDAKKICASALAGGYDFSCEVTTAPNGDVVTTRVMAMRPDDGGWSAVTRGELRTGKLVPGDPSQHAIHPDEIWFERQVESVHSDTFLTSAYEKVRAPDLATAERQWTVSVGAMQDLVTNPALVIPKPPIGDNGCPWMLHPDNIQCGVPDPNAAR